MSQMGTGQVSVFLAAAQLTTVLQDMLPPFQSDPGRFRIASIAADWEQAKTQVSNMVPDVLVIEADLSPGINDLIAFFQHIRSLVIVILPPAWVQAEGAVREVQNVREVLIAPHVNYAEVASMAYSHVISERALRLHAEPMRSVVSAGGVQQAPVGLRVFAFWSSKGGTGKSTLSLNFAYELARRGIRTLLMGFDVPDDIGTYLHLPKSPNALSYFQHPGLEGFRAGIQTKDSLDVMLSPGDFVRAEEIAQRAPEEDGSIKQLVLTAYQAGYAAVVLDLPPTETEWTLQPLMAANALLFVAQPSFADQVKLVAAFRLLSETMAGQHRIPVENMYIVLNAVTSQDNLTPDAFHKGAADYLGRAFPPVIATVPWDPEVRACGNRGELACLSTDAFARSIRALADTFYRGVSGHGGKDGNNPGKGKTINLGFFRVRVK